MTRAEVGLITALEHLLLLWLGVGSAALWCGAAARGAGATWSELRLGEVATVRAGLLAACMLPLALAWLMRTDLTRSLRERSS